jgi:hypothetical protein
MFEFVMVLCFAYAGFCFLLPGTAERGSGESEEEQSRGNRRGGETNDRLSPRGRHCRSRNEAGPRRPLLSRAS